MVLFFGCQAAVCFVVLLLMAARNHFVSTLFLLSGGCGHELLYMFILDFLHN